MSTAAQLPARAAPHVTGAVVWAALGDSFTAGSRPGEWTWAAIAARTLSCPARPVELRCLAATGATCRQVADEQLEPAIASNPGFVSLICGANDVIGSVRPRVETIASALDGLWFALRSALPGRPLLTATYPALGPQRYGPRTRARIAAALGELNRSIRAVAARHAVACVDLEVHPGNGERANFAADGLHPSPLGQLLAAGAIAPAIAPLIREEIPA